MKHRISATALLAISLLAPASTAFAQNKVETQLFLETRQTQAMISQLALAVNTLIEQLKRTDGKVDEQAAALLKGFLDQKSQIDTLQASQKTIMEREGENGVKVQQLELEMRTIRTAIQAQQTTLNEILTALQQPTAATSADATGGQPPTTTLPKPGANIPPSPGAYYATAFQYAMGSKYDDAIQMLTDAISKFPDWPEAARAQVEIGIAQEALGHDKEALAAYALAIQNYKDPDVVPDAYYRQGLIYERLNQKDNAKKSLDQILKLYPNTSTAALATLALKRMGFIK